MEFRQLQALLAVADSESFTKAADELFLTQSAVTRQIGALEKECRTRLFDRLGRRVVLTPAGAMLEKYAREILRLDTEATQAVNDVVFGIAGKFSVGCSSTAAAYLLPPILQAFRSTHGDVEISVLTGPSQRVADLVQANSADVGLVMDMPHVAGLTTVEVATYSIALIVYPNHPIIQQASGRGVRLDELSGLPLILMQEGASLRNSADRLLGQSNATLKVSMELDNVEAIKKMIGAKLGVSLLPIMSVVNETKSGTLVALPVDSPNPPKPSIVVIHRQDKYVTKTMQAFIDLASRLLSEPD